MKKRVWMKRVTSCVLALVMAVACVGVPATDVQAAQPKKAVYLLPGFMGSQLYSNKFAGMTIWVGAGLITEIGLDAVGAQAEMVNNASGTGMSAYADRNRDTVGTLGNCLPLITSIKTCLAQNGLSDTYAVEFFSYNYLADLNETAQDLAADIEKKGYESVILVTHSNGALLASAFVGQSSENKQKVEKAIALAPPLWGTFTALEPVETGGVTLFDSSLSMAMLELGYDIFVRPITKQWVKSWAKNAPNIYQLMAGHEYISQVPVLYRTASSTQVITGASDYYALLNQSPNINPILVNGNARSLQYLRETVYQKDVLSVWSGIDLTMIGCEYGFITPVSAVYHQSGTQAIYDGAIYSKEGDGIVAGVSMKGDGRFPFINLPGASHVPILLDVRALAAVNSLILGHPVSNFTDLSSVSSTSSVLPSVGMSDMIRMEVKSADPLHANLRNAGLSVIVYDQKGAIVAQAKGETQVGFRDNNFVYSSWETSENATNILCYIPKEGYRVEVLSGNANRFASSVTVCTETLDPSGSLLSRNEYRLTGANLLTGSIFTLDGSKSMMPVSTFGTRLRMVSSASYNGNWDFASETMSLQQGTAATPDVTGTDASTMVKSAFVWTSSDTAVATVSPSGVITAKTAGTAVITAAAKDSSLKMESINLTVTD